MQYLNDDMDELFRKAADDYPLNTGAPDWDKVAMGLTQDTPPVPVEPRKRYRRFLWFFLLIPIGFIIKEIADPVLFKSRAGSDIDQNGGTDGIAATQKAQVKPKEHDGINANAPADDANVPVANNSANEKAGTVSNEEGMNKSGDSRQSTQSAPVRSSGHPESSRNLSATATGAASNKNNSQPSSKQPSKSGGGVALGAASSSEAKKGATQVSPSEVDGSDNEGANIDPYAKLGVVPFSAPADVTLGASRKLTTLEAGPITRQKAKTRNFYLGAIGGVDVTTVKFQETSKMGGHFGAIAGYSFAKRWSVELGFIVEKKYYYSDGKYFDKSKLNLNANTTVISVDGDCNMFEIPVSVKYDITNTYRSNFFVTGGLSSYIMKQEDYTMVYGYTSGSRSTHYYPYKNSSKNFFAEIRLTGGYAFKLPRQFSVRIEPYWNIPVSGVGYGNLNLMSAGVNAGIFRRIF